MRRLAIWMLVAGWGVSALAAEHGHDEKERVFDCVLEPHRVVEISSPVAGILQDVEVERGDTVQKGQVLFRLDARVRKAEERLARVRMEYAARRVARNRQMRKEDLIPESKMDELESDLEKAKAEWEVARARLSQYVVKSPIDAVVMEQHHFAGEHIRDESVLKLAQINPLNVEVVVPAGIAQELRPGEDATVFVGASSAPYRATIRIVEPVIDAASGTVGVQLRLSNEDRRVAAGALCRVRFSDIADVPGSKVD